VSPTAPSALPDFAHVYGVDFSGARLAGRTTWIAHLVPAAAPGGASGGASGGPPGGPPWTLAALDSLERLAGTAERGPALAHLTRLVRASDRALWAFDFPFGLPLEVLPPRSGWRAHGRLVREFEGDGYGMGLECVRRARARGGPMHVRRLTDARARAPFDPYHYRIIYQTFYGLRDVAGPLAAAPDTALLPFQYARAGRARRVLVETCPASTLKRLGLPHQRYKQPEGGPLTAVRRRTRRAILDGLAPHVALDGPGHPAGRLRRRAMRDPGGDALDAVIAALGAAQAVAGADHAAIARHPRYRREGHLFY
jgi:hypothetical protein